MNFLWHNKKIILVTTALLATQTSCLKKNSSAAQNLTLTIDGETTNQDQKKLLEGLVTALSNEFNLPEGTKPHLKADVILRKLEIQLGLMETDLKKNPNAYGSAQVTPDLIVEALEKSFVRDYFIEKDRTGLNFPRAARSYSIDKASLIPMVSKLVTSLIRKNPRGQSFKQTALGATPIPSGPKKNLIFKAIQRENPQMDPSNRMDNVYMVADFHRITLSSVYLDTPEDGRDFLTFSNLHKMLPKLKRIVVSTSALKTIMESLHFGVLQKPGDYPSDLTLVLTDPPTTQVITFLETSLRSYRGFAGLFRGIGFSDNMPYKFLDLASMIREHKFKSIEVNLPQINMQNLDSLTKLATQVVLNDQNLVNRYYSEAVHLDSTSLNDCLWSSPTINKNVEIYIRLTKGLILRGIPVVISPFAKSALTSVEAITAPAK